MDGPARIAALSINSIKRWINMDMLISYIRAKISNWLFYRAFKRAPVMVLGNLLVKDVQGNFYVVGDTDKGVDIHGD
jgi:hypothetical protein